ncbi:hypothetical protein [Burkholderia gladioli]|uniref:hypothetical protein n=1 Tax=Burkholderia gladioli TaxID=28095 RepID=UPI0016408BDE|nr:hypothetical protein [Burkholderia gladioli]
MTDTNTTTLTDDFRGDDSNLVRSIEALINLNDEGALVPHGIGGHARGLLSAAAVRLASPRAAVPGAGAGVPAERGIYAWVAEGCSALVHVHTRPTVHSPGGVMNGSLLRSSEFYDGCPIDQWSGGTWYGPLKHPAAPGAEPAPDPLRRRVERLLVELHAEGRLSEGQCVRVLDIPRENWRELAEFLSSASQAVAADAAPADEPSEIEQVIACLGDDAAKLREANPDDEMADNMEAAARLLSERAALSPAPVDEAAQDEQALLDEALSNHGYGHASVDGRERHHFKKGFKARAAVSPATAAMPPDVAFKPWHERHADVFSNEGDAWRAFLDARATISQSTAERVYYGGSVGAGPVAFDEPATAESKCTRCGSSTAQACNELGCFYLESGEGEPATADERAALREMLDDARNEFTMVREALGVPYEPHQTLLERTLDAARASQAAAPADPALVVSRQLVIDWAVERWTLEVNGRPLGNIHRRSLDDTWRQFIRYLGADDVSLLGPRHDDLIAAHSLSIPLPDSEGGEA